MSIETQSGKAKRVKGIASVVVLVGTVAIGTWYEHGASEGSREALSQSSSSPTLVLDESMECASYSRRVDDPSSLVYENEHTNATPISSHGDIFGPSVPTEIC